MIERKVKIIQKELIETYPKRIYKETEIEITVRGIDEKEFDKNLNQSINFYNDTKVNCGLVPGDGIKLKRRQSVL